MWGKRALVVWQPLTCRFPHPDFRVLLAYNLAAVSQENDISATTSTSTSTPTRLPVVLEMASNGSAKRSRSEIEAEEKANPIPTEGQ